MMYYLRNYYYIYLFNELLNLKLYQFIIIINFLFLFQLNLKDYNYLLYLNNLIIHI